MESTILIALITAIAAIVAPVITALINNCHDIKVRKIEAKENRLKNVNLHEREVLENALSGIGLLLSWEDENSIKEACKNLLIATAYVNQNTANYMISIVDSVMKDDKTVSLEMYTNVCIDLKNEISNRTKE